MGRPLLRVGAACALALFVAGCADDYPIAPRTCDDFCRATERHGCAERSPADCVQECERLPAARRPDCEERFRALVECLDGAADSEFACDEGVAEPASACLELRRTLAECLAPGGRACAEACWREAELCRSSVWRCERACHELPPDCGAESSGFYECSRSVPVDCDRFFGEPDPRPPEEIPCFGETLEFLACTQR